MARCGARHPEDKSRTCVLVAGTHDYHGDPAGAWPNPEVQEVLEIKRAHRPSRRGSRAKMLEMTAKASKGRVEHLNAERRDQQARARTFDPETSHQAAASVRDLRLNQRQVYDLLDQAGPMSDERLIERAHEMGIKQSTSGLRTRRRELVDLGLVEDSGERTVTKNDRSTIVWQVCPISGEN